MHDGLHVRCERHPEHVAILSTPQDFKSKCPEGGCTLVCGEELSCGAHKCALKCHRVSDHSKVMCQETVEVSCDKGHSYPIKCGTSNMACSTCFQDEEDLRRRAKRDLDLEKSRKKRRGQYRQELQRLQDEVAHEKRRAEDEAETKAEQQKLADVRRKLKALQQKKKRDEAVQDAQQAATTQPTEGIASNGSMDSTPSASQDAGQSALVEWATMKLDEHAESEEIDTLMKIIGLENIKLEFLNIKSVIDLGIRQSIPVGNGRYGCTLLGNPGTGKQTLSPEERVTRTLLISCVGKTTVARIYGRFLASMGVLPSEEFVESTGSKLASIGVQGCQGLIDKVLDNGGGVIFIDEAYQLSSGNSGGGAAVLDFLLAEVENLRSKVVFILAGYAKQMESFFAHNPGFPSRFPLEMKFDDYSDDELVQILALQVNERFGRRMKVENGLTGLYCRIVARRLGRGRGKEGFGNARAVENSLAEVYRRQAKRLREGRRRQASGLDDMLLTKSDLIGPRPSTALAESEAWKSLQSLIGLDAVKESVKVLVDTLETNYDRELAEEPIIEFNLNRIFLGNPGTGKTIIAKLYGQLLSEMGILSNGEVVVKNPSDFVGDVLGASENLTKAILASTVGKVLVIDEAYSFYSGGHGGVDIYKAAAIDTIVATVHSTPGDDRCILLLGYHDQMQDMLQNMNPGLSRRFPMVSAFTFEDFNPEQLTRIFEMKLQGQGFGVTEKAKEVAMQSLERSRNQPHFGNAGEVDILLNEAKARHQKRLASGDTSPRQRLRLWTLTRTTAGLIMRRPTSHSSSRALSDVIALLPRLKAIKLPYAG